MRYAVDELIIGMIKRLEVESPILYQGNPVSIYTEPPTNAPFPQIAIQPSTMTRFADNADDVDEAHLINITVVSEFKSGSGGWGVNNALVKQIVQAIDTKSNYIDLSADNFDIIRQEVFSVTKIRDAYDEALYFQTEIMVEFEVIDKA